MTVPAGLLTEWARLMAATLRQAGVQDVVVSPGSRSTPFVWAALRQEGLRCRSIIDERDAGFFAVGHARLTGRPVALLCTSGSAAANYFPAVVEASRSAVPLLVLTADRPFELQGADAPQTIDQVRLYGTFARTYLDPGMPDDHPAALRALQRTIAQAVHAATWPSPGPVHVNLRARKPLEPISPDNPDDASLGERVDRLIEAGPARAAVPDIRPSREAADRLAAACARARRGVIVGGPVAPCHAPDPATVLELARQTGFAVLPEASSQLRFRSDPGGDVVVLDAFDTLLRGRSFRAAFTPDVVIQLGSPPTSTGWRELGAGQPLLERHVLALHEWSDPRGDARSMLHGPLDAALETLIDALGRGGHTPAPDRPWLDWLRASARHAWEAVDAALEAETEPSEGQAVRTVVDAVPRGAVLALGNSLPVREVDTFCPAADRGLTVWTQRGASGIDGLVAGAAGAAAGAGRPTGLLLGDVSMLHDIGGLASARDSEAPLAIVVLDNGGGRIFEQLPFADTDPDPAVLRFWTTPPDLRLEAAAGAFGVRYRRPASVADLDATVREALGAEGATLIHVAVDGERTVPLHRRIWRDVDARVEDLPAPEPEERS